jgi:hypothetical protein
MVTRSRASQPTIISAAAASLQQAARSNRSAPTQIPTTQHKEARVVSEEEQKRSVQGLYQARKWVLQTESELHSQLERDLSGQEINAHGQYEAVHAIRLQLESLCAQLNSGETDAITVEALRQTIKQLDTLK